MQRTHVLRRAMPPTAVLLVCFVSATLLGVAGVTPSARGQTTENEAIRLERDRLHRDPGGGPGGRRAGPSGRRAQPGDGAGRGLRRRERDRRRLPAVPRRAAGGSGRLEGGGGGDRRVPRARRLPRQHAPADGAGARAAVDAPAALRRLAGGGAGRVRRGRRDRGRRGRRGRHAHEPSERRPFRLLQVRARHRSRRLAARSAGGSERDRRSGPDPLGRLRPAVPGPGRRHAPDRRPQRPHERRIRGGLQRGEAGRLPDQHDAHRGSDGGGDLLAGQRDRDLEPRLPEPRPRTGSRHRGQRSPLRDDQPGRGRRLHRLLERQGLPQLLEAHHGDPGGGERREPGDRRPIRHGFRSSTRPSRFRAPRWSRRGSPITRRATPASAARS